MIAMTYVSLTARSAPLTAVFMVLLVSPPVPWKRVGDEHHVRKTVRAILIGILLAFFPLVSLGADPAADVQYQKERALAETLKKLVTCKTIGDDARYCSLSFRGLKLEFAGVNKDGRTIYEFTLGKPVH